MVYQIRLGHAIGAVGTVVMVQTHNPEEAIRAALSDWKAAGRTESAVVLEMKPHEGRIIEVDHGETE